MPSTGFSAGAWSASSSPLRVSWIVISLKSCPSGIAAQPYRRGGGVSRAPQTPRPRPTRRRRAGPSPEREELAAGAVEEHRDREGGDALPSTDEAQPLPRARLDG